MADIRKLAPIFLKWEAGAHPQLTLEQQWEIARKKGFSNDPCDAGGATMCGVTISTYSRYKQIKNKPKPSVNDLKKITLDEWLDILKMFYWDKMKADRIENQSIANLCVDMCWGSGSVTAIRKIQKCLGVAVDGVVGQRTLAALNGFNKAEIHSKLWEMRKIWFINIANARPANKRFLKGWLNRLNDLNFSKL